MNYLAHLTLSHFSADLQVGNFLGDLIRGREVGTYRPELRRGVEMHRAIDRATDTYPEVWRLNSRLRAIHGRYAPVISDIAFDYFLWLNWQAVMPEPFETFRHRTYANLTDALPELSPRVAGYVHSMVADDWLLRYTSHQGMSSVFTRLRSRLSKPELLDGIEDTLVDLAPAFNRTFMHLFPHLQALSDTYRDHPPTP